MEYLNRYYRALIERKVKAENRILKIPYKNRYRDLKEEVVVSHMTWDGVARDKPIEISKLQEVKSNSIPQQGGRSKKQSNVGFEALV